MQEIQTQYIREAIKLLGSQEHLAIACGVSQQAVSKWVCNKITKLPLEQAMAIERATDGKITWKQILPKIY